MLKERTFLREYYTNSRHYCSFLYSEFDNYLFDLINVLHFFVLSSIVVDYP